jgi:hypothetical protein
VTLNHVLLGDGDMLAPAVAVTRRLTGRKKTTTKSSTAASLAGVNVEHPAEVKLPAKEVKRVVDGMEKK